MLPVLVVPVLLLLLLLLPGPTSLAKAATFPEHTECGGGGRPRTPSERRPVQRLPRPEWKRRVWVCPRERAAPTFRRGSAERAEEVERPPVSKMAPLVQLPPTPLCLPQAGGKGLELMVSVAPLWGLNAGPGGALMRETSQEGKPDATVRSRTEGGDRVPVVSLVAKGPNRVSLRSQMSSNLARMEMRNPQTRYREAWPMPVPPGLLRPPLPLPLPLPVPISLPVPTTIQLLTMMRTISLVAAPMTTMGLLLLVTANGHRQQP